MRRDIATLTTRRLMGGAVSVALVMVLAACGSDSSDSSTSAASGGSCSDLPDGPVKIGSILPLSGAFAALGATNDTGTKLAVKAFNASNDICGRKIELVREDDKGDPAEAVTLGRKLTSQGVNIFVNAGRGETGDALTPFLMKAGAISISDAGFGARFDVEKYPTFYGVSPTNVQYMQAAFDHIKARGWAKVGLLNDGLTGGNEYVEVLSELLDKDGAPVLEVVNYSPTAIDLTSQLQQLRSAGVETLVLTGTSNITNIVSSLKTSGWTPHLVGWGGFLAYAVSPESLPAGTTDQCYTSLPSDQAPDGTDGLSEVTLNLLQDAAAELGDSNPGINGSHEALTRLLVAKAAVEKAGSTDPKELKVAMDSLQNVEAAWPGISLSYSADDHAGYPQEALKMCGLVSSPLGIRYQAAG